MYRIIIKLLVVAALLAIVGIVAAEDKFREEGTFSLEAAASGDEDTLTFVVEVEEGDSLKIELDIDTSEGEWELVLEDPDGNEVGSMTDDDVDHADDVDDGGNSNDNDNDKDFKYESEGAVEDGEYVFTFTNVGDEAASVSGEYEIEIKDDDRYFFDPGARMVIYIRIDIISLWVIGPGGEGYEAIVIDFDDIWEKLEDYIIIVDTDDDDADDNDDDDGDTDDDEDDDDGSVYLDFDWDDLNLEENVLITESEDGMVKLYILTTGEFQVNVGPFEDGTVQVFIYDSFPPTSVYRADFNVYHVLEELENSDD
jgi:hypothetical protein